MAEPTKCRFMAVKLFLKLITRGALNVTTYFVYSIPSLKYRLIIVSCLPLQKYFSKKAIKMIVFTMMYTTIFFFLADYYSTSRIMLNKR